MYRKLVAKISAISASRDFNNFIQATNNLKEVQKRLLYRQLKIVSRSKFAEDYKLHSVDTYNDYTRKIPILKYEKISPYIEELKKGNTRGLLNPKEKIVMFALTSGTTAEPKFIPVTKTFLKDYKRGWNVFGLKAILDHPSVFLRKIIQITSSDREIKTPSGIWAGAITGLLARTQKWIVKKHYTTPLEVAKVNEPEEKMYIIARLGIVEDVGFISTANPSTVLRLTTTIERSAEKLIKDIYDGRCTVEGEKSRQVVTILTRKGLLKRDTKKAEELERILHKHGRLTPKYIWRGLGFLANWTGGTLKLYLQSFPEYFGDTPVRDIGLLASEGRFSVPIEDNTPVGILEITSNLFEFIPEAEYENPNPEVLSADKLRAGEKYFLVFSNATGLCRYDIGDLIRVVDFYNQTPMIEFLNKGAHISSITGEKLTERQVIEATEKLTTLIGEKIENFSLQPVWADPPYYEFTVEKSVIKNNDKLAELLDNILAEINIEYGSKRKTHRLGKIKVRTVEDGYFYRDDIQKLKKMGRSEQYKRKFLINQIKQVQ